MSSIASCTRRSFSETKKRPVVKQNDPKRALASITALKAFEFLSPNELTFNLDDGFPVLQLLGFDPPIDVV